MNKNDKILGYKPSIEEKINLDYYRNSDDPQISGSWCDGYTLYDYGPLLMVRVQDLLERIESLESQVENLQNRLMGDDL
jgi:hypothetical protein